MRAKLLIDAQFSSELDLDEIADESCFSKFHFVRRSIYGRTPDQYLTDVRIARAKELFKRNTLTIVAFSIGMEVSGVSCSVGHRDGGGVTIIRLAPGEFQWYISF